MPTDKERQALMRKQIAQLGDRERELLLCRIVDHLWPEGDTDHEWDADTTEGIAREFFDVGIEVM